MKLLFFLLSHLACIYCLAQNNPVTIPGSVTHIVNSKSVKDQQYELQILLPSNYKIGAKKYPIVYVMDAQWDFTLVKSIYGQQFFDGFIPELIICGITWTGKYANADSLRVRDYTPSKDGRIQGGGANDFLKVMEQEIFPIMENSYNASNNRTLVGCSLGGLFTLYAMFTHTTLFSNYIAATPAMGWDKEIIYKYENEFKAKIITSPITLYTTFGDVESYLPRYKMFVDTLVSRNYANVKIVSKVLENTGHSGTKSETYSRGIQFAFERNKLLLSENIVAKYLGTYQLPNGNIIEIKQEANTVYWLDNISKNKIALYANTQHHLYAVHEFFNLHFNNTDTNVLGFNWQRYGNTVFVKKIKNEVK